MNPVIAALAQYGFVVSFAIAAVVWLRLPRRSKWELLAIGVVGSLLCLAFISVGGALYYHPRPFVSDRVEPLFPHVADNGFPSDHTVLTMFVALCVLYFSRRWGLVLVTISLVAAVARVLAHVHSPLDIAGAVAMAAIAAVPAHAIVTRLETRVLRRRAQHTGPRG